MPNQRPCRSARSRTICSIPHILRVDGSDVGTMDDLQRLMDGHAIDRVTDLTIYRGGRTIALKVQLTELPA